jgi:hypothetical protein
LLIARTSEELIDETPAKIKHPGDGEKVLEQSTQFFALLLSILTLILALAQWTV